MKRWRCLHCWTPEAVEAEWEDYLQQSFCRMCGQQGVRIHEFGCFACDEQGRVFWGEEAPSHPCPDCNSPAYRIVHAPYVATGERREDYHIADQMLEKELATQRISSTTLKREVKPEPDMPGFGWVSPGQVAGRVAADAKVNVVGSIPRPQTTIVASYDKKE